MIFSLFMAQAHAGLWQKICDAFVMDDPYQYEQAPIEWIENEIARLEIKEKWKTITLHELKLLEILKSEWSRR